MVLGEGIIFSLHSGMIEWVFESLAIGGGFHEIKSKLMCYRIAVGIMEFKVRFMNVVTGSCDHGVGILGVKGKH